MSIPRRSGRTSRAAADFLVDKSEYVLGALPSDAREESEPDRNRLGLRRQLFAEQIEKAYIATSDPDLQACFLFVKSDEAREQCVASLSPLGSASNDLFAFEVSGRLVHEGAAVQSYFSVLRRFGEREC